MVSGISIFLMAVTLLISVGFPIGLSIYLYKKQKISIKGILVGALMFFIFQVVLRIPILTYIQHKPFYISFASENMLLVGILIAFTAALFETVGRFVGLKFLIKDKLNRKNSIAYGIGHGGIESILLVGITYMFNIYYSIMINAGISSPMLELINTSPIMFLSAGIERFFTILLHIALSVLVAYGIMFNKKIYILYCLLFHTFVDSIAVIMQIYKLKVWEIEAFVAVAGLLSLAFIVQSRKMFSVIQSEKNYGGNKNENI